MRQRNDTTAAWHFAASDNAEVRTVAPGETIEHPVLLDGWSPAGDPKPAAGQAEEQPRARAKKSIADDDIKGGEPR
ncbi:hypothetical protein [Streptomyces sp. URMC 124]|uniref:hypothetical protein n=1 Tax=Streptomyces sp. URMC 124 TaxID=3423405 RepID=UPI003F1A64F7